jgi:hypothetical protein
MAKASSTNTPKASAKPAVVRKHAAEKVIKRPFDASLVATKPLKGPEALELLKTVGIVTRRGKLALAYS